MYGRVQTTWKLYSANGTSVDAQLIDHSIEKQKVVDVFKCNSGTQTAFVAPRVCIDTRKFARTRWCNRIRSIVKIDLCRSKNHVFCNFRYQPLIFFKFWLHDRSSRAKTHLVDSFAVVICEIFVQSAHCSNQSSSWFRSRMWVALPWKQVYLGHFLSDQGVPYVDFVQLIETERSTLVLVQSIQKCIQEVPFCKWSVGKMPIFRHFFAKMNG